MAITNLTLTPVAGGGFRLDWASDLAGTPTFYVYRDGVRILTTQRRSLVVAPVVGASPAYEVLDDPAAPPTVSPFPGYVLLAWYAAPATAYYRIEQLIDGQWVEQASIRDDGDRGLPPRIVVVQQGGNFLNGTYALNYAGRTGPGSSLRWLYTDGVTTAEIADGGGGEWLLRLSDNAGHFVTYGSNLSLPEYPPAGEALSASGGAWTLRLQNVGGGPKGRVAVERPTGNYFTWRSGGLADSTTHQFRITPVGTNGNDGTVKPFSLLMIRRPDPPQVKYEFSATTGQVTISAL